MTTRQDEQGEAEIKDCWYWYCARTHRDCRVQTLQPVKCQNLYGCNSVYHTVDDSTVNITSFHHCSSRRGRYGSYLSLPGLKALTHAPVATAAPFYFPPAPTFFPVRLHGRIGDSNPLELEHPPQWLRLARFLAGQRTYVRTYIHTYVACRYPPPLCTTSASPHVSRYRCRLSPTMTPAAAGAALVPYCSGRLGRRMSMYLYRRYDRYVPLWFFFFFSHRLDDDILGGNQLK